MTIEIPVTYSDIKTAYENLIACTENAFSNQKIMNSLESEKADIWAQLTSNPDFKPGNSNLQRDAKLRAANPLFMDKYERYVQLTEGFRMESEVLKNKIGMMKDMLALGKILLAIKDD